MSVMSTLWDRQLRLFTKGDALTDTTGRTWPPARQMIELHSNFTMWINIQHWKKTFEEAYSIIFTDLTSNHSNLNYLESKWINLLQASININKTILLFIDNEKNIKPITLRQPIFHLKKLVKIVIYFFIHSANTLIVSLFDRVIIK